MKINFFNGSEDWNFWILKTIKMFGPIPIKIVRSKEGLRKFIKYYVGIFMSNNASLTYSIVGYLLKIRNLIIYKSIKCWKEYKTPNNLKDLNHEYW
jgi:hypothetical protein